MKTQQIWSAAPTPMRHDGTIDTDSIDRLMTHQLALGVEGVFIGGTSGEGPWLSRADRITLVRATMAAAANRMPVALQITDNSAERMLEFLDDLGETRPDYVVIAPPFFQSDASQSYLEKLYLRVIEHSPVPVGLYHRGPYSSVPVEAATLAAIAQHPKVKMIKDSSGLAADRDCFFAARGGNPRLRVFNGDEFNCAAAAQAGFDGMLLGGACFNAGIVRGILALAVEGRQEEAQRRQEELNRMMLEIFGGDDLHAWLGGQKQILVELGVFSSNYCILNYPLDAVTAAAIRRVVRERGQELRTVCEAWTV